MFFDMGASYAMATIVEYRTVQVKEGEKAEMIPQLTVKVGGAGWKGGWGRVERWMWQSEKVGGAGWKVGVVRWVGQSRIGLDHPFFSLPKDSLYTTCISHECT